jgi:ElaB/YqjD/DUF883 family membrane-anchored ribosome-binding protein
MAADTDAFPEPLQGADMNHPTDTTPTPALAGDVAERLAEKADDMIRSGKRVVETSSRAVQARLDNLGETVPGAVSRVAAQAEDLSRRGIDRARQTALDARDRAAQVADVTIDRIKARPVKAMMISATFGALLALWLSHSRRNG